MSTFEPVDEPDVPEPLSGALDDVATELSRLEPLHDDPTSAPAELEQKLPELGYYEAALLSLRSALLRELDEHGPPSS
jgi:hypothetical protein